jgi:hypothetical protein
VHKIIGELQLQGIAFHSAIDLSVKTAQDGYKFSADAEYLYETLLEGSSDKEEVVEFVGELKVIAKKAHKDALDASESFRSVRSGIFEVSVIWLDERRY